MSPKPYLPNKMEKQKVPPLLIHKINSDLLLYFLLSSEKNVTNSIEKISKITQSVFLLHNFKLLLFW